MKHFRLARKFCFRIITRFQTFVKVMTIFGLKLISMFCIQFSYFILCIKKAVFAVEGKAMELTGRVKSFNPHKGWGFVDFNGEDIFLHKSDLKGFCPSKGAKVQFTLGRTEKGAKAENVKVVSPPFEETSYYGSIKSYHPSKGFGFISSEAFPDQDVFVFWSNLPGGFGPDGSPCKFSISMDEKGPAAKKVMLLGAVGAQVWQMKWMMGYSDFGKRSSDKTCWDLKKHGTCARAAEGKCRWKPCKARVCTGVESRLVKTWLE